MWTPRSALRDVGACSVAADWIPLQQGVPLRKLDHGNSVWWIMAVAASPSGSAPDLCPFAESQLLLAQLQSKGEYNHGLEFRISASLKIEITMKITTFQN